MTAVIIEIGRGNLTPEELAAVITVLRARAAVHTATSRREPGETAGAPCRWHHRHVLDDPRSWRARASEPRVRPDHYYG